MDKKSLLGLVIPLLLTSPVFALTISPVVNNPFTSVKVAIAYDIWYVETTEGLYWLYCNTTGNNLCYLYHNTSLIRTYNYTEMASGFFATNCSCKGSPDVAAVIQAVPQNQREIVIVSPPCYCEDGYTRMLVHTPNLSYFGYIWMPSSANPLKTIGYDDNHIFVLGEDTINKTYVLAIYTFENYATDFINIPVDPTFYFTITWIEPIYENGVISKIKITFEANPSYPSKVCDIDIYAKNVSCFDAYNPPVDVYKILFDEGEGPYLAYYDANDPHIIHVNIGSSVYNETINLSDSVVNTFGPYSNTISKVVVSPWGRLYLFITNITLKGLGQDTVEGVAFLESNGTVTRITFKIENTTILPVFHADMSRPNVHLFEPDADRVFTLLPVDALLILTEENVTPPLNKPPIVNISVEKYVTTSIVPINISVKDDSPEVNLTIVVKSVDGLRVVYNDTVTVTPPANLSINVTLPEFYDYIVKVEATDGVNNVSVNKSFTYTRPISIEDVLDFNTEPLGVLKEVENISVYFRVNLPPHPIKISVSMNGSLLFSYVYDEVKENQVSKDIYVGEISRNETPIEFLLTMEDLVFNKTIKAKYELVAPNVTYNITIKPIKNVTKIFIYRKKDGGYAIIWGIGNVTYSVEYTAKDLTGGNVTIYVDAVPMTEENITQPTVEGENLYTHIYRNIYIYREYYTTVIGDNTTKIITRRGIVKSAYWNFYASLHPQININMWRNETTKDVYLYVEVKGGYGTTDLEVKVLKDNETIFHREETYPSSLRFNRTYNLGNLTEGSYIVDIVMKNTADLNRTLYEYIKTKEIKAPTQPPSTQPTTPSTRGGTTGGGIGGGTGGGVAVSTKPKIPWLLIILAILAAIILYWMFRGSSQE